MGENETRISDHAAPIARVMSALAQINNEIEISRTTTPER